MTHFHRLAAGSLEGHTINDTGTASSGTAATASSSPGPNNTTSPYLPSPGAVCTSTAPATRSTSHAPGMPAAA